MNPIISIIQTTIDFIFKNELVKVIIFFLFFMITVYAVIVYVAYKAENKKGWLNGANLISMFYGVFMLLLGLVVIVIPIIDKNQSVNDVELSNVILVFILGSLKIFIDTLKDTIELNQL